MAQRPDFKRQMLEERKAALEEDIKAVSRQINWASSNVEILRLERQQEYLFQRLDQLEIQLSQLETSQPKPTTNLADTAQPLSDQIMNSENFLDRESALRDIIESIFLSELYFLRRPDAFPNADLSESVKNLSYGGSPISLILPIQPSFFQRNDASNLLTKLKIERLRAGTAIKLIMQVDDNLLEKEYELKNENAINGFPVAEIWPNFMHPDWKIYYGYSLLDIDDENFRIEFPNITNPLKNVHTFGRSKISRFTNFPSHIICLYHDESVGIIPLKTPSPIKGSEIEWNIGVCIGNSYTNVYVSDSQYQTIVKFSFENLHYRITASDNTTRIPALEKCFIPLKQDLPIANLLTQKDSRNKIGSKDTKAEVIFDARIYAPQDPTQEVEVDRQNFLIGNLQWSSRDHRTPMGLFIEQLALQISAQAMKNGVTSIQWRLSYPATFSKDDKESYVNTWNECSTKLNNLTGLKYKKLSTAKNSKQFQSESLAIIRFFNATQEKTPNNTTCCIDIGGNSSEISIWESHNNVLTPVLQCSIRLGVRHLFSDVIKRSPTFLRHIRFTNDEFTEALLQLSKRNKSDLFYRLLDAVLKGGSEDWLNEHREDLEGDEQMSGYLQILAIGIAGLYYYIGMVLQVLHRADESNFREHESGQPVNIYFGGNGSRLLNWLSYTGEFDGDELGDLFQEMMIQASKLEPVAVTSVISSRPKDEVAYGLVVKENTLTSRTFIKEAIIAGEPCQIGVHRFEWDDYIEVNSEIFETTAELQVFNLVNLPQFLYCLHKQLRSKSDISISPVEGYSLGDTKRTDDENLVNTFEDNLDLWESVYEQLEDSLALDEATVESIHLDPPFILGLKALIEILAKRWARK
jgi:hypothetical protein